MWSVKKSPASVSNNPGGIFSFTLKNALSIYCGENVVESEIFHTSCFILPQLPHDEQNLFSPILSTRNFIMQQITMDRIFPLLFCSWHKQSSQQTESILLMTQGSGSRWTESLLFYLLESSWHNHDGQNPSPILFMPQTSRPWWTESFHTYFFYSLQLFLLLSLAVCCCLW